MKWMNPLFIVSLLFPIFLQASEITGLLRLKEGYIFLPVKGSTVTAGYGTIENISGKNLEVSLVNAEGFKVAELHQTVTINEMMKMQKVSSVPIKTGSILELKPGGSHIMLFDPITELEVGDLVPISFRVNDQNVTLQFPVKSRIESESDGK